MLIRLTRLSNERHRFEIVRANGASDARELETRSFLIHDLVHFAIESEAQLGASFYGRLAAGESYEALGAAPPPTGEGMQTERIVGPIQSAFARDDWPTRDTDTFAAMLAASFANLGEEAPDWLNGDLIRRVRERLRQIMGQWRATPFHQTMELAFRAMPSDSRTKARD